MDQAELHSSTKPSCLHYNSSAHQSQCHHYSRCCQPKMSVVVQLPCQQSSDTECLCLQRGRRLSSLLMEPLLLLQQMEYLWRPGKVHVICWTRHCKSGSFSTEMQYWIASHYCGWNWTFFTERAAQHCLALFLWSFCEAGCCRDWAHLRVTPTPIAPHQHFSRWTYLERLSDCTVHLWSTPHLGVEYEVVYPSSAASLSAGKADTGLASAERLPFVLSVYQTKTCQI